MRHQRRRTYRHRRRRNGGARTRTTTKRSIPDSADINTRTMRPRFAPNIRAAAPRTAATIPTVDLETRFFNSPNIVSHRNELQSKLDARNASKSSIGRFIISPPATRDANFLQAICSDTNFCTAFGRETDRINRLFEFTTFKHMLPQVKLLTSGNNGFVNELTYDVNGYKAAAVLKTTITEGADNVYLEAYNGIRFINKFAKQFPCFLETYGAFAMNNPVMKRTLVSDTSSGALITIDPGSLRAALKPIPVKAFTTEIAAETCKNNANLSVLIQYIHQPTTFWTWFMANRANAYAFCVELPILLFQIYAVLATLDGVFTHFDLHGGNILLYKIPDNGYVVMNYKNAVDGATITLKTPYIVKIIDYGRSFLPDNQKLYSVLCNTAQCTDSDGVKCGESMGYTFFEKNPARPAGEDDFFISSNRYNNAHDLRNVYTLWSISGKYNGVNALYMRYILQSIGVEYEKNAVDTNKVYGTPHKPVTTTPASFATFGTTPVPPPIHNVQELYWVLCRLIQHVPYFAEKMNDMYISAIPYGTLDIDLRFSLENTISGETSEPIMSFRKEIETSPPISPSPTTTPHSEV